MTILDRSVWFKAVKLLTCVREVPSSYLGWNSFLTEDFHGFLESLQRNSGIIL
jgi:hypothetical protein